jgi:D-lactate dehydrogenase (cytochrome)
MNKSIINFHNINNSFQDYLSDESRMKGFAEEIVFPKCENDVLEIIQFSSENNKCITISAGRTGITGGAVPEKDIIMSMEKMNRLLGIGYDTEKDEWFARVEPGIILSDLQQFINQKSFLDMENTPSSQEKEDLLKLQKNSFSLFYPPDPTEKTATIGGTVSCNASGARSLGFGSTRNYVRRIRVVLASGEILDIKRGQFFADSSGVFSIDLQKEKISFRIPGYSLLDIKNTAGYYSRPGMDLIDLFIGSEGTLGVFTEIELRLLKHPNNILGVLFYLSSEEEAISFVKMARGEKTDNFSISKNAIAQSLEYFGPHAMDLLGEKRKTDGPSSIIPSFPESAKCMVYYEVLFNGDLYDEIFESLEKMLSKLDASFDNSWAETDQQGIEKMRLLRHAIPELINAKIGIINSVHPGITKIGTDFAVADEHLSSIMKTYRSILENSGLEYLIFGHIGNNHLHINIIPSSEDEYSKGKKICIEIAKRILKISGTVTAEHGIGKLKKELLYMMLGEEGIADMKQIKEVLDPCGIFNPGNLF